MVVVIGVLMGVVMGSEGDGVPVKHSPAGAHRVAESKPEQEAVVVVKNTEEQRSQKPRGVQWSYRRVLDEHNFLRFQHSSTH